MNNPNRPSLPERNPYTRDRHQRQVLWQVYVPIGVAVLIVVLLAVLVTATSSPQVQRLSDISTIFLILPTAAVTLLVLVILAALVYLTARILIVLPSYARLVQITLERFTTFLNNLADSSTKPVVGVGSAWAGLTALFRRPGSNGSGGMGQRGPR
jgi:hypothetical protein